MDLTPVRQYAQAMGSEQTTTHTAMETIQILTVNSTLNQTQEFISNLRNAGIPVHARCENLPDEVLATLEGGGIDLILCLTDKASIEVATVRNWLDRSGCDASLLAIGNDRDPQLAIRSFASGARDFVDQEQPALLQSIVRREVEDLSTRRALKGMRQQLLEAETRCQTFMERASDAVTYIQDGMHVNANHAYLKMFGLKDFSELDGIPVMDMVASEDQARFKAFLRDFQRTQDNSQRIDFLGHRSGGETFQIRIQLGETYYDGEPSLLLLVQDLSDQHELQQQIDTLSRQDVLTGLINRQEFMNKLEHELEHPHTPLSVVFLRLSGFRRLVDESGIEAGDQLIRQFSDVLRKSCGAADLVARFGDQEFAMALHQQDKAALLDCTGRLIEKSRQLSTMLEGESPVRAAVGITLHGKRSVNGPELVAQARKACANALQQESSEPVLHDVLADFGIDAKGETQYLRLLRSALARNEFRLLYQPIVSLRGGAAETYAVLLRLPDGRGEDLMPSQFIAVAAENGMVGAVDRWVIKQSIQVLAAQRTEDRPMKFFINLSADSVSDPDLPAWIGEQIQHNRLPGESICFQIADTAIANRLDDFQKFLERVRPLRCRIALDQVGDSSSIQKLLPQLQVHYLKLNGVLAQEDSHDEHSGLDILRELNTMAHEAKVETIAKAVEDANILAPLWNIGVDFIQGYFLQPPSESLSYDFNMVSE